MGKDLFLTVFEELSRFSWSEYQFQFLDELHINLLNAATKLNGEVAEHPAFAHVYDLLVQDRARQSRNPEIFPPIYEVLLRGVGEDARSVLGRLRLQVEDRAIDECLTKDGFYRRTYFTPHLLIRSRNSCKSLDENVIIDVDGVHFPLVYFPTAGLFDDIVGRDVYWGSSAPFTRDEARRTLRRAATSLKKYSTEIYSGFCDSVRVLALTGEPVEDVPRSFSARTLYSGGIFSAIKLNNVPAMVENLIHEYYHQRLWLWWMIEGPADLPDEQTRIVSPITGATKTVQVMLHAFLIYVSVIDYYRWTIDHEENSEGSRAWAKRRLEALSINSIELRNRLFDSLDGRPETKRFVSCVGDHLSRC